MSSIGYPGRELKILYMGEPIAAVRSKSVQKNRAAIDNTDEDAFGWRSLMSSPDHTETVVNVSGVATSANYWWMLEAWLGNTLLDISILHPQGTAETPEDGAYLSALQYGGEVDGFVAFSASFILSGFILISEFCELDVQDIAAVAAWTGPVHPTIYQSGIEFDGSVFTEQTMNWDDSYTQLAFTGPSGSRRIHRWLRTFDIDGNELSNVETEMPMLDGYVNMEGQMVANSAHIMAARKYAASTGSDVSGWYFNGAIGNRPITPPIGSPKNYFYAVEFGASTNALYVPDDYVYVIGRTAGSPVRRWVARYPVGVSGPASVATASYEFYATDAVSPGASLAGFDAEGRVYLARNGPFGGGDGTYQLLRLSADLELIDTFTFPISSGIGDSFCVYCGQFATWCASNSTQIRVYDIDDGMTQVASLPRQGFYGYHPRYIAPHHVYYQAPSPAPTQRQLIQVAGA